MIVARRSKFTCSRARRLHLLEVGARRIDRRRAAGWTVRAAAGRSRVVATNTLICTYYRWVKSGRDRKVLDLHYRTGSPRIAETIGNLLVLCAVSDPVRTWRQAFALFVARHGKPGLRLPSLSSLRRAIPPKIAAALKRLFQRRRQGRQAEFEFTLWLAAFRLTTSRRAGRAFAMLGKSHKRVSGGFDPSQGSQGSHPPLKLATQMISGPCIGTPENDRIADLTSGADGASRAPLQPSPFIAN